MDTVRISDISPESVAFAAGRRLRDLRERLGLTLRAVEDASNAIAEAYGNSEFAIPPSRLSDIETKGTVPSLYRLHTLALIYRVTREEILTWYGVPAALVPPVPLPVTPKTHIVEVAQGAKERVHLPYRLDPAFDERKTVDFGRFVQQWGSVPMKFVEGMAQGNYIYGYIGSQDLTMYPILPPGSFVQVDPSRTRVRKALWRSDYDRPIYFVETRDDYLCGWCVVRDGKLIIQPHPMSPCEVRILKLHSEAEVMGQVVGAAIRLSDLPALRSE